MSARAWWTAVLYIATVALFLRYYDLPLKPLHHDEGVNALLLSSLVEPPHAYRYDPANYHGPTLYYFGWLSTAAFGVTTVALRFVPALAGLAAVVALLGLRRHIGQAGALSAAALLAVSPGAVYFSRYFIHEMLLVCFTLAMVVALAAWGRRRSAFFLHLAAVSAGLMFATKETALISAVVLAGAAAGSSLFFRALLAVREARPADQMRHVAPEPQGWKRSLVPALQAVGLFLAVNLLFYTSLFTHWQGAIDALRTFAFWTRTGIAAHTRPWHAYLGWLSAEELPLLLLGAVGAALASWQARSRFAVFAALWAVGMLAAYSLIPYKTPWLTLNMIAPLTICGGYACELAWQQRRAWPRGALTAAAAIVVGIAAYQAVVLSFVQYDNDRYPYVYAHTSRDLLRLVDDIHRIEARHRGSSIAVTSRDHFPLSWYLRAYRAGYYGRPVVTGDPLVIASEEQRETLDRSLSSAYQRVGSYALRPGVRLVLYVRRDLGDGGAR
jgi:uncharacterized protein (TIGR03663 family)